MNAEKYTQKALDAVKTAQNMAQENGNQYVTTEHLLYALLDQDGGLIGSLFGKMGVDCDGLLSELDTLIRNLPRISDLGRGVHLAAAAGDAGQIADQRVELGDTAQAYVPSQPWCEPSLDEYSKSRFCTSSAYSPPSAA